MSKHKEDLTIQLESCKAQLKETKKQLQLIERKYSELEKNNTSIYQDKITLTLENKNLRLQLKTISLYSKNILEYSCKIKDQVSELISTCVHNENSSIENVSIQDENRTKIIRPMVGGHVIQTPVINLKRFDAEDLERMAISYTTNENNLGQSTKVNGDEESRNLEIHAGQSLPVFSGIFNDVKIYLTPLQDMPTLNPKIAQKLQNLREKSNNTPTKTGSSKVYKERTSVPASSLALPSTSAAASSLTLPSSSGLTNTPSIPSKKKTSIVSQKSRKPKKRSTYRKKMKFGCKKSSSKKALVTQTAENLKSIKKGTFDIGKKVDVLDSTVLPQTSSSLVQNNPNQLIKRTRSEVRNSQDNLKNFLKNNSAVNAGDGENLVEKFETMRMLGLTPTINFQRTDVVNVNSPNNNNSKNMRKVLSSLHIDMKMPKSLTTNQRNKSRVVFSEKMQPRKRIQKKSKSGVRRISKNLTCASCNRVCLKNLKCGGCFKDYHLSCFKRKKKISKLCPRCTNRTSKKDF